MSVEVRLLGVTCNLACTYCYQEPIREAGNYRSKYDLNKVIGELDRVGHEFHLFGGEALLVPKQDMEVLFKYGLEKYGKNAVQTNGTLIDDDHIALFKKYKVGVGVSIDGPGELNDLREVRAGTRGTEKKRQKTRESTDLILSNLKKLRDNGVGVGVIVTLHRINGMPDKLPRLINMIEWLSNIGIKDGNIHVLEVDATMPDQDKHVLSQEENIEAFLTLAKFFSSRPDLNWKPFSDAKYMLDYKTDNATCFWKTCDPMNTQAVYGIEGNGALSNCGRTSKEGIDWYKADDKNYSRYISFYYTPDEMGGCQGCRFWAMCTGSCPGEAIDNDFRNKTSHCQTQKALLGHYEKELEKEGKVPLSKSPLLPAIERIYLDMMMAGREPILAEAIKLLQTPMKVEVKENVDETITI